MKRLLFVLLLLSTLSYAQPRLEGRVYLYQEKGNNRTLPDVSIRATGSGSAVTKADGYYAFTFDNSVDVTTLTVMKIGYEIINQEDLRHVELGKKQQQNVYFDIEGNTEKRKRELFDAAMRQFRKRSNEYYAILDKGGVEAENLKKKLEKGAGKTFANLDEVRSYVYEKFGADEKTLGEVVSSVIRLNLDHTNKDVEKIKQYTLSGDLKSALTLLNIEQGFVKIRRNNELIKTAAQDNLAEKEKFLAGIPLLLSNGLYSKVDSVYQLAMEADTADKELKFTYARFLQDQKQFTKAINLYQSYIKSLVPEWEYGRALNNLGLLMNNINEKQEARKHYEEALEIQRRLAQKNPEAYEPDVARTLNNMGALLSVIKEKEGARKHYVEALEIQRRLAQKNPETYEPYVAATLNNMGALLSVIDEKEGARKHYVEALEIRRRLAQKNPEVYESDVAMTLNNLGVLLSDINEKEGARKHYIEALEIRRRLAQKNPEAYELYVARTLNNLGVLLSDINEKEGARKRYQESLEIQRRLAQKNPEAYEPDVAATLYNLGNLLSDINEKEGARKHYVEALEIRRRLAQKNPEVYESDVATTLNNLGVLLSYINQKQEARKHYEEALGIYRRLVKKNPQAYRFEVTRVAYNMGRVSQELKLFEATVIAYKEALFHAKLLRIEENSGISTVEIVITKLIEAYRSTAHPDSVIRYSKEYYGFVLSVSEAARNVNWYGKAISVSGDIASAYNDLCAADSAAAYYAKTLDHQNAFLQLIENVLKNDPGKEDVRKMYASYNGNASWYTLHTRQAEKAEQYARKALETDPSALWVNTNLAHALLLQNRYGEAEELYRSLKSRPYGQDASKTYGEVLLKDLQQLACSGAIPPEHQAEVEKVKAFLRE